MVEGSKGKRDIVKAQPIKSVSFPARVRKIGNSHVIVVPTSARSVMPLDVDEATWVTIDKWELHEGEKFTEQA